MFIQKNWCIGRRLLTDICINVPCIWKKIRVKNNIMENDIWSNCLLMEVNCKVGSSTSYDEMIQNSHVVNHVRKLGDNFCCILLSDTEGSM